MNVSLPDGGTATLRDPRTMPSRYSDIISDAQTDLMFTDAGAVLGGAKNNDEAKALQEEFDALSPAEQIRKFGKAGVMAMRAYSRATVLALVSEWPYGPVDEATLLDLVPGDALSVLEAEVTKVMAATGGPNLDTSPPKPVDGVLPEGPSEPSSA